MKAHNYTSIRTAPGGVFDNVPAGRIMVWMHPAKAIRALGAVAAFAVLTGCETTADSVPKQTIITPPAENIVLVAQAASADETVRSSVAATNQPVVENKETVPTVTNDVATVSEPKPDTVTTNQTPVIQEEVAPTIPQNLNISEATEKIIKLAQGGVDENVMLVFVDKTQERFDLEADEIVYLSDLGVPSSVLTAMLKKDGVDPGKVEELTAANNTEVAQPNLPPANVASQPPVEITTNYVPTTVVQEAPPQQVIVQQPQTVVVTPQPETVSYFYDSLSPYGSWFVTPEFGWCWQPTVAVVDRGWRPYGHRGRWIYSTSGWYWHSDYSWGWAPFHYGRWHLAGHRGWIWVPDRVWGPAWVSWRTADDYAGWAPLPPAAVYSPGFGFSYYGSSVGVSFGFGLGADAYCFAPIGFFHHRNVWNYCLPGYRSHHIYNRSYVHNRYDWDRNHRHPVNNGIPRRQIERAINRELRPVPVREAPAQQLAGRTGIRERLERNGNDSVIVRPSLPARSQIGNAVRASATTPQQSPAPGANIGGSSARFNRNTGQRVSEAAVVPSPAPAPGRATPAPSPGQSPVRSRAERTVTPAPSTATPTPRVTQPSIDNRIGASRRDRVFGSTSPSPATPAPSPAVPATPTPVPSGRDIVRRDATSRPPTVTPTTPAPAPNVRNDIGRNIQTSPRVQTTTPAPTPRFNAPNPQPQPVTPSPRMVTPQPSSPRVVTPQSAAPAPRVANPTPQPQRSAPTRAYSPPAPARTPHYSPPPAPSVPRSAPPAASPAPANRGSGSSPAPAPSRSSGGDRGSFSRDVQNRVGR